MKDITLQAGAKYAISHRSIWGRELDFSGVGKLVSTEPAYDVKDEDTGVIIPVYEFEVEGAKEPLNFLLTEIIAKLN